jgi:hypothetical protein
MTMMSRVLISLLLCLTLLVPAVCADDFGLEPKGLFDGLPAGIVNVAQRDFGHDIIIPGDYGLGNIVKVEDWRRGTEQEVRIFRSPELRISHKRPAQMNVLLGNVKILYVWIETPPIQGSWHLSIEEEFFDGTRTQVLTKDMKPGVRDSFNVDPNTQLHIKLSTKTTAVKIPMKFVLTISPVLYAVYPDFLPMPYRTIYE